MERKFINWAGLLVSLVAFILGFVVLFTDVKFMGVGSSLSEFKSDLDALIESGMITTDDLDILKESELSGTFGRILTTQLAGWAAVVLGLFGTIGFTIFSLEEAGTMSSDLQNNKGIIALIATFLGLAVIAFIVGFVAKDGIMDTYLEELIAVGVTL